MTVQNVHEDEHNHSFCVVILKDLRFLAILGGQQAKHQLRPSSLWSHHNLGNIVQCSIKWAKKAIAEHLAVSAVLYKCSDQTHNIGILVQCFNNWAVEVIVRILAMVSVYGWSNETDNFGNLV